MRGWIEGIQKSIDFMEQNLTQALEIEVIAEKAALSPFYYQRIFGALCGMTVGEYVRSRRMTLAAQELSRKDAKVIDVAMKYGYDAPDSFAKAFQKFHGITPSQAREPGAPLRSFAPLHIKITMEGGSMLAYQIVRKAAFTIVGVRRRFHSDTGYQEIPAGCETRVIPASVWAQFPCTIDTLQDTNTKIWSEWLPALQGYSLAGEYDVEVYLPPMDGREKMTVAIWVPLKKD